MCVYRHAYALGVCACVCACMHAYALDVCVHGYALGGLVCMHEYALGVCMDLHIH